MLRKNGGVTKVSQTLKILYTQLANFKRFGPPSIPHIPLNKAEKEYVTNAFFDIAEKYPLFIKDSEEDKSEIILQCASCQSFIEEEDKVKDLKFWYKQMEDGTSVEYRCPACRDCAKCKNSDFTDKVSIREEVEQQAVGRRQYYFRQGEQEDMGILA